MKLTGLRVIDLSVFLPGPYLTLALADHRQASRRGDGVAAREEVEVLPHPQVVAKGAGGGLFFRTDDIQTTYEDLVERGVEFSQPPEQRPYGLDAGFRDPSGNHMRVMQAS